MATVLASSVGSVRDNVSNMQVCSQMRSFAVSASGNASTLKDIKTYLIKQFFEENPSRRGDNVTLDTSGGWTATVSIGQKWRRKALEAVARFRGEARESGLVAA